MRRSDDRDFASICLRDPFMSGNQLRHEIADGVAFWGYEDIWRRLRRRLEPGRMPYGPSAFWLFRRYWNVPERQIERVQPGERSCKPEAGSRARARLTAPPAGII